MRPKLHGAAIYNPHLLSREELVALFCARQGLLDRLVETLRSAPPDGPPQHHLILGQRGIGKTMLLHRLIYAVEDDPDLSWDWLALPFPEEQYNVASLADFWLNCADALSDRLEALGKREEAERIDEQIEALRGAGDEERRPAALALLTGAARRLERRLVLLIDNADLVFDRIGEEDWSLREALSSEPALAFVGASAAATESTYDYGRAFYDFFQIHELRGLTLDETRELLLHYAGVWGDAVVAEIAENQPARLKTLHTLTGGNPRTVVLLYQVFSRGLDGDVRSDLEQLLDHCTPLYKARFEALPAQAQQVVHAVATHWDPISAGELARLMRLEVNKVSAQLNRLVQQGVIEKVPYDPPTKTGFQIAERFFNIWYLMRASRRVRRRLIWLVEFLRMFYSQDELGEKALSLLRFDDLPPDQRLAHAEFAFALARALESSGLREALEDAGLHTILSTQNLRSRIQELIDLRGEDSELRDRAEYRERYRRIREQLYAKSQESGLSHDEIDWLIRTPMGSIAQKEVLLAAKPSDLANLARSVSELFDEVFALHRRGAVWESLLTACSRGMMESFDDLSGAKYAEVALGEPGLLRLVVFVSLAFVIKQSLPDETVQVAIAFLLALASLQADNWEEAQGYCRLALTRLRSRETQGGDDNVLESTALYLLMIEFFREAATRGFAAESASLVDDYQLSARWRPFREALVAFATADETPLNRYASEVRQTALEILRSFKQARSAEGNTDAGD